MLDNFDPDTYDSMSLKEKDALFDQINLKQDINHVFNIDPSDFTFKLIQILVEHRDFDEQYFCKVPKELRTREVALMALERDLSLLCDFDKGIFLETDWPWLLDISPESFEVMPQTLQTLENVLAHVQDSPNCIKQVREDLRTDAVIELAVEKFGQAITYLCPQHPKYLEYCKKAVSNNLSSLRCLEVSLESMIRHPERLTTWNEILQVADLKAEVKMVVDMNRMMGGSLVSNSLMFIQNQLCDSLVDELSELDRLQVQARDTLLTFIELCEQGNINTQALQELIVNKPLIEAKTRHLRSNVDDLSI